MVRVDGGRAARTTVAYPVAPAHKSGSRAVASWRGDEESPRSTPLLPAQPRPVGKSRATLTIMSGMDAGRVVPLGDSLVIGRDAEGGLSIEEPGLSRKHARIWRTAEGGFSIVDLGSTNGTLVHGRRVTEALLSSGDYVQLGNALLVRFAVIDPTEEEMRRQLYESSSHDPLTRVFNRRYFFGRLEAEIASARRTGDPLAVLMVDVDEFKLFNDTFGHMPGDRALCFIAAQIGRVLRAGNVLARYGGEEFVVLSPGADHEAAVRLAERIRRGVQDMCFSVAANAVSLTVSVGVASIADLDADADPAPMSALVSLADQRLYQAKRAGRNRVGAG